MAKKPKLTSKERKEKQEAWAAGNALKKQGMTSLPVNNLIPAGVARITSDLDSTFTEPYKLVFEYYNHNVCDLHSVTNRDLTKQIISTLNKITKYGPANKKMLVKDSVKRDGQYKQLYENLSEEDIVLEELPFSDGGRIFCHFIGSFCSVVAIRANHLEKKKK